MECGANPRSLRSGARDAGVDPGKELAAHISPDGDPDRFWESVATNLHAGNLRLVLVADAIPHELRRIVEFLNEQMTRTDVLAVEVRQYVASDTDLVTLVPRIIGQTEAARDTKRSASGRVRRSWAEAVQALACRARRPDRGPEDDQSKLMATPSVNPDGAGERMLELYEFLRDRRTTLVGVPGRPRP